MNQTRWNVDCGCLVFQCLSLTEAIILSRTNHFWYEISSRRAAYPRMKFPSFEDKFDILEYHHWQEVGRQRLALTSKQFVEWSTSRVIGWGVQDLELILDTSCFDPTHPSQLTHQSSIKWIETELLTAIPRYHSIVALTITIGPMLHPYYYTKQLPKDSEELHRQFVARLITHLASKLISLQLLPPDHSSIGLDFAHGLSSLLPTSLTLPNLLHANVPVMIDDDSTYVRWASLIPFHTKGVLEISSFARSNGPGLVPVREWDTIDMCPTEVTNSPAHLLINYQQRYQSIVGHSPINRSLNEILPSMEEFSLESAEKYFREVIPPGANYQEVGFSLQHWDDEDDDYEPIDFTPLRQLGDSVRIFNLEVDPLRDSDTSYLALMEWLGAVDGTAQSDQDGGSSGESPFTHVTQVRITSINHAIYRSSNRSCFDITPISSLCPNLTHLEVSGSLCLSLYSLDKFQQLRHLTTPLPNINGPDDGVDDRYIMDILLQLRQLESLHLLLDPSPKVFKLADADDDELADDVRHHFLDVLLLSSPYLTEVIISCELPSSGVWLPERRPNYFYQWLVHLQLIWHMIQPTHQLPLEKMSLTPVTCMVDLLPLLTTFLRHPFHQLPYLRHRCQQLAEKHPSPLPPPAKVHSNKPNPYFQPNWFSRLVDFTLKLTSRVIHPRFPSHTSSEKHKRLLSADKFSNRAELVAHLSARSRALRDRITQIQAQTAHDYPSANFNSTSIDVRPHFRIIVHLSLGEPSLIRSIPSFDPPRMNGS